MQKGGVMQFGNWEDFANRKCGSCKKPLVGEKPVALVMEYDCWFHEPCLLQAKRQLAGAMMLARVTSAVAEYQARREEKIYFDFL